MARINIEDAIYSDVRFHDLLAKCQGDSDKALGIIVRAWSLAQAWYLKKETNQMIPISEWKKQRISDLLVEVGLAQVNDDLVYVCGSHEQFAWLLQKSRAGESSAEAKRKKKEEPVEHPLTDSSTHVNGSQPLSLSPSLSLSQNTNTPPTPKGGSVGGLSPDEVIQAFNDQLALPKIGRIQFCSGLNRKQEKQFFDTVSRPEFSKLEHWVELFELVKKSPLLRGTLKGKSWVVTLGWIVDYDHAKDISNGAYPETLTEAAVEVDF